jgi:hypothetical protein
MVSPAGEQRCCLQQCRALATQVFTHVESHAGVQTYHVLSTDPVFTNVASTAGEQSCNIKALALKMSNHDKSSAQSRTAIPRATGYLQKQMSHHVESSTSAPSLVTSKHP